MAQRISDKLVKATEAPAKSNRVTYDTDVKGFGLRVTAAGAKGFVLNYRANGRERRYTIGAYPDWSVVAARDEAKALKRRIARGEDPMAERHDARAGATMADLAARYLEEHAIKKRPSSQLQDRQMLEKIILPRLGRMKVADVTYRDVDALHRSRKRTPYRANRVLALLSKMFALSIRWQMRADNPVKGVERFPEVKRRRYLSPAELGRLAAALDAYPHHQSANAIRLLLLTGARVGEVLGATWDQLELGRGTWTKPGAMTKQKTEHQVPLSAPARQLLARMKETATSEHVFPGKATGGPQREIKRAWSTIRKTADLEGARLHDLRHTYASILASAGQSLPVIGALLGHTQPATTARYAHLYDDPLREATERVGAVVTGAGKDTAQVVELRTGGDST